MENENPNNNQVQQPVVENVVLNQIQESPIVQPVVNESKPPKKKSKTGVSD